MVESIPRIAYFGTAPIAIPPLEALLKAPDMDVVVVVTQPDRPQGRKRKLAPCAVKDFALEKGLDVLSPEKIGEARDTLETYRLDVSVVFAYGQYIPRSVRELTRLPMLNIHPSLLPRYRGAAPITWALVNGDAETGVSIIEVSEEMDAGAIFAQATLPIAPDETGISLSEKAAICGSDLLLKTIRDFVKGLTMARPQDPALATYARKLEKKDAQLDWSKPAIQLERQIRAFQPWPGSHFFWDAISGPIKVHEAEVATATGEPGEVLEIQGAGPLVACGEGSLRLHSLQVPGKKPISGTDFLNGFSLQQGLRFY